MHKYLKILLIVWLALSHSLVVARSAIAQYNADTIATPNQTGLVYAQYSSESRYAPSGTNVDVEPPLIEHDVVAEAEAGIRQTFVATIVDDEELDQVLFYYRFAGETAFSRYTMMRVSFSYTYIAQIPTDPNNLNAIEYYIQARDTSGNRTVRGYAFSPLVRQIVVPVEETSVAGAAGAQSTPTAGAEGTVSGSSGSHLPKILYIVGGVLLLGLLASAASSSGGDSGSSGGGECMDDGCRVTLTVPRPF